MTSDKPWIGLELKGQDTDTVTVAWFRLVPVMAWGYKARQVGVDSNLLHLPGRVVFVQADGSLTALSDTTGKVLGRLVRESDDFMGPLREANGYILARCWSGLDVIDPKELRLIQVA